MTHNTPQKLITITITICVLITTTALAQPSTTTHQTTNTPIQQTHLTSYLTDQHAYILTASDPYYTESSLSFITLTNPPITQHDLLNTHGDDELLIHNNHLYILNRFGYDLIEVFDITNNYQKILEFTTGPYTNPQDMVFISDTKAYISLYSSTDLLIVNPQNGKHIGSINMSAYADADGIPEMHKMNAFTFLGKNRVYLTIQRLDRNNYFTPTNKSYIIEINADTDTIIRAITLTGTNPVTKPILDGTHIIIGETGSYTNYTDGGIERIHLFTNEAEGFFITEADLGGNILDIDIQPRYRIIPGYLLTIIENLLGITLFTKYLPILIANNSYITQIHTYNLKTNTLTPLYTSTGYHITDICQTTKNILLSTNRDPTHPGIHLFELTTNTQLTSDPLPTGTYPPVHIILSP